MQRWKCSRCDHWHSELPLAYGASAPALWYSIPEAEREHRVMLTSDICVIDEQHGFIVGNLELPILGTNQHFSWDVWASLSFANLQRTFQLWERPERESEPPYFGWLSTQLPGYADTVNLKTHVHTRAVGRRPYIELEPTDHPLAIEQREGITWERVQAIAETVLHSET